MNDVWQWIADTGALDWQLVASIVIVVVAVLVGAGLGHLAGRRVDDRFRRYYSRKLIRYVVAGLAAIALGIVWRPFAGQLGLFLGIITAGVALALQDVVGALAGTLSVASGGIFRVGDRIELGGVRGDVIDISLLRTTLMEVGPTTDGGMEVHGRQYTGRLISISNKAIFTAPVFNYTASFEFTWEEIVLPIPYTANWGVADAILQEEAERISASEGASAAIELMARRYPLGRADVDPRVYARATDNYLELAARFVVPVRRSRIAKDEITRRVVARLEAAGIPIASQTVSVTVEQADRPAG